MRKSLHLLTLVAIFLFAAVGKAEAYDFSAENDDGVTIYYNIVDGNAEVTYKYRFSQNYSGEVSIPSSVTYKGATYSITSIGDYAFQFCSNLTSVTIPSSVTSIGNQTFVGCSSLTSINVASSNKAYCSQDGVLFSKDKTTIVCCPNGKTGIYTIPEGVTSIGEAAFVGCHSLTSVTIPNSVMSIGKEAFSGCNGLSTVCIPSSVTIIGTRTFFECSSLTSVTISEGVTSIGDMAFQSCSSLTSVTIPGSVTSFGDYAFASCSSLTSVTIPGSVTSIGSSAFEGCSSLTSVYSYITDLFFIYKYTFSSETYSDAILYVPKGMKETYASTDYWNNFTKIEEMSDAPTSISSAETQTETKAYNLRGIQVKSPQRGIVIKDGKKVLRK